MLSSLSLLDLSDENLVKLTSVELHELLSKIDKPTSIRRHPNEERKIRRFDYLLYLLYLIKDNGNNILHVNDVKQIMR